MTGLETLTREAPSDGKLYLVPTRDDHVKEITPREAFFHVIKTKGLPHFEPLTIVGGSGAIKTMVGYGVVKRIRQAGVPVQLYILSSGSAFMALEGLVEDKEELERFVHSIPNLIELRQLPKGEKLLINRLNEERRKQAEYLAYIHMSREAMQVQTPLGVVTVNKGVYDTSRLDERLQELLYKSTGTRPKLKDNPKAQIIAQILGRGSVVLNEEFPDMYVDEGISAAIRIPQYFPPKVHESNGKLYILMDSMWAGYFPLRKELLQDVKGPILALLYGHHRQKEIAPTEIDLSGYGGYFLNQRIREESMGTEFVQSCTKWTTGKSTPELADNGDERVYLIAPNIDIPPFTIKVKPNRLLELIELGMKEADAFLARCRKPVWWLPKHHKNGYIGNDHSENSSLRRVAHRLYSGLKSFAPSANIVS